MDKYRQQLEGTRRLLRLRRIRRVAVSVLVVLGLLVSGYALVFRGVSLQPLYVPLDAFLPFLLVLLVLATLTNFAFRALEFRYVHGDNHRFMMAHTSIRRATVALVVSAVLAAVLLLPLTGQVVHDGLSQMREGVLPPGETVAYTFDNQDRLALAPFIGGRVSALGCDAQCASVRVSTEDGRLVSVGDVAADPFEFFVDTGDFTPYTVSILNPTTQAVAYRMELDRVMMPDLTASIPFVLIALAAANGGWIAYLRPLRKRYKALSIYSIEYVEEVGTGERTFADYHRGMEPPVEAIPAAGSGPADAAILPALAEPLPPPPPDEVDPAASLADGRRSLDEGRYDAALATVDDVLAIEPSNVPALLARATALQRLGRRREALEVYATVLTLDPLCDEALCGRARVLGEEGRWEDAVDAWSAYLEIAPDDVDALVNKGAALRGGGRADEALAAFDLALDRTPRHSLALWEKGRTLERRGAFEEALSTYDELLETNPRDAAVWACQGSVLEKLGDSDEALAAYREALKIDPSLEDVRAKSGALEASQEGEEAFLEELFTINGVGPARARALLAAGYRSGKALRDATEDELANVRGVTRKLAAELCRHFHGEPSDPEAVDSRTD